METIKLRGGFYWASIIDDELYVFDIVIYTGLGTAYNSYVMKTESKVVLFETVKVRFFDEYLEELEAVIDVTRIDYLMTNHTEPNHAGSVERLLDCSPRVKILATPCAISFLKEIVNRDFIDITVKDDQRVTIGKRTLHFVLIPSLRWPNIIYIFIEEEQILVTCDSFGSYYCLEEVVSGRIQDEDDYLKALRYYFDCIIGLHKPFMLKALNRVKSLDINMVCTGHGLVLAGGRIKRAMALYREWSTVVNPSREKTVVIPYVSACGYTGLLAEKVARGISDSGGIGVRCYDMVTADTAKVQEELQFADGMLFGTPTITAGALRPIWDLVLGMFGVTHGEKYTGALGSYSWSGEGVPHITERLKQLEMKVVDGLGVRFKLSEADLVSAYEFEYQFGCLVQSKKPGAAVAKGSERLVKCLICGETFGSPIETCPVCDVGRENFAPVDDVVSDFTNNTANEYLILGNDAAGFNAAKAVRERDATGWIIMVSEGPYPSYDRFMLTKSLVAGLEPEQITIVDAAWYKENQMHQILGRRVESVDMDTRGVLLDDGTRLHFTKLIYALEGECFIPPIEGNKLPEVAAIRRLSDIKKVETLMKSAGKTVVIGGGALGLEAAWELKRAGPEVTMLEMAPSLMGHQLDESSGEQLRTIASKTGVIIHIGADVEAIKGEGHVSGVRLEARGVVEAGMIVVSAGIRVNIELAKDMGLEAKKGMVANELMETSVSDIYACGDRAQYHDVDCGIWPEAAEQGRTAGADAVDDSLEYAPVPAALAFHGMNTALFATGGNERNPDFYYETMEFRDMGKEQYREYYFLDNRMGGIALLGGLSRMTVMTEALENHAAYQDLMESQGGIEQATKGNVMQWHEIIRILCQERCPCFLTDHITLCLNSFIFCYRMFRQFMGS